MNREKILVRLGVSKFDFSEKFSKSTSEDLRKITEWEEYKEVLVATEAYEKLMNDGK